MSLTKRELAIKERLENAMPDHGILVISANWKTPMNRQTLMVQMEKKLLTFSKGVPQAMIASLPTDIAYLLDTVSKLREALKDIKSGCNGRAQIFGEELKRCPTCASAETAATALEETK